MAPPSTGAGPPPATLSARPRERSPGPPARAAPWGSGVRPEGALGVDAVQLLVVQAEPPQEVLLSAEPLPALGVGVLGDRAARRVDRVLDLPAGELLQRQRPGVLEEPRRRRHRVLIPLEDDGPGVLVELHRDVLEVAEQDRGTVLAERPPPLLRGGELHLGPGGLRLGRALLPGDLGHVLLVPVLPRLRGAGVGADLTALAEPVAPAARLAREQPLAVLAEGSALALKRVSLDVGGGGHVVLLLAVPGWSWRLDSNVSTKLAVSIAKVAKLSAIQTVLSGQDEETFLEDCEEVCEEDCLVW